MNKIRNLSLPLVLAVLLAGCGNLDYYAQAIGGHFNILSSTVPISDIIRDPTSDSGLKKKLEDVQAIHEFAIRELGLPDNNSYRSYADVGRPYVVWNVFAVPEFSLTPKHWCLLVVGCVSYRGYYDKRDAESLAMELRQEGYDTFVGGVAAYSTLGYFDDPVLNTILRQGTPAVAHVVFHELAHQLVFVKDDSQFNESFATAVENEGMRRWLAAHATPEQRAAFETQQIRQLAFSELMREYFKKFYALYETSLSLDQQRDAKAELLDALRDSYADLKVSWNGYTGYDPFFGADLNNAKLVSLSLYSELVPAFEALLDQHSHDLPQFYRHVDAVAGLSKEARHRMLTQLLPASSNTKLVLSEQPRT